MNVQQYVKEICAGIDAARANLWGTGVTRTGIRPATDNFQRIHDRQSKRAELWAGIIAYREEEIDFAELLMFLQSFDSKVTPDDVYELLGDKYHG